MGLKRDPTSANRIVERLLRRCTLAPDSPPERDGWQTFLDALRSLLGDLDQDRYLLERSFETSSAEMLRLHQQLKVGAEKLANERTELQHANSILRGTLESTADGILVVDGVGGITNFNGRFAQMWNIPAEILDEMDDATALRFVLDQLVDPDAFVAKVQHLYATPDVHSHDLLHFKDGRIFERVSLPQRIDGDVVGRVWSFRDITEQSRLETQLAHQAFPDPLTSLANRALLADHVDQALRRAVRTHRSVALALLDLDGFKNVNDSLGHKTGDDLLIAVSDRLREHLRDIDTIARLGGDEFAVVIDDLDRPEKCGRAGERIVNAFASPLIMGDRTFSVSASVGIAVSGAEHHHTPESLLSDADAAMYRAKQEGRNCYQIFESWMHLAAVERLEIEQALRGAIDGDELFLEYQPIFGVDQQRIVEFEALARWSSPTKGNVPPDVFIPIAEETGLIVELGQAVLYLACAQAKQWSACHPDVPTSVAVNVSRFQLGAPNFGKIVDLVLDHTDLDPSLLTIEVTESVLAASSERVRANLDSIHQSGVRIAIDDFGTGYSSLATLAELPIDILKVDKCFIDDIATDDRKQGIVNAIIQLARALHLVTVAEGVEEPEQLRKLTALGCARIQGYLLARPLSVFDASACLERQRVRAASSAPRARHCSSRGFELPAS